MEGYPTRPACCFQFRVLFRDLVVILKLDYEDTSFSPHTLPFFFMRIFPKVGNYFELIRIVRLLETATWG